MKNSLLIILFTILTIKNSHCQYFKPLISDDLESIGKNKSIVFWRIKIIDKTNYFKNRHEEDWKKGDYANIKERKHVNNSSNDSYFPTFEMFQNKQVYVSSISSVTNSYRNAYDFKKLKWKWSTIDSASVLDELIVLKAKPGDYFMDRISFFVSTVRDTMLAGTGWGTSGNVSIKNYYNIKAERKFSATEDSLTYFGRIEIVIDNFNDDPIVRFYVDKESQETDMELFTTQYPQIINMFRGKLIASKLKMLFLDNHYYDIGLDRKAQNRNWQNGVYDTYSIWKEGNKHTIKSQVETCPYVYVKLNYYEMPKNYKISFSSKWISGNNSEGYSLILGSDYQNAYFFNGSGKGYAGVWYNKNGSFVKNPIEWKEKAIYVGDGKIDNRHLIIVEDEKLKYYTNGKLIGEFNLSIFTNNWIIGFQVCNKQNVSFSNLIVEELD